ncbi:hypothetical protein [Planomicrobium sp. YIM 101495]|uniref:hypothetical protein n=1 Tax=Planomicrobium sp. YIM 101495 TaxID=2665160 RepID=UPI0012B88D77|nr:hypothetical protein [Planomicrobium sp. YIM 101495]MTD32169.1 hypothetical protein [Planomicrobium sp. YIM 101495]
MEFGIDLTREKELCLSNIAFHQIHIALHVFDIAFRNLHIALHALDIAFHQIQ